MIFLLSLVDGGRGGSSVREAMQEYVQISQVPKGRDHETHFGTYLYETNERLGWRNLLILDADKMRRKVELSNGPRLPPPIHHSWTGSPPNLIPRGLGWRGCLHLKGLKKTWLGLWSRTSPDKES